MRNKRKDSALKGASQGLLGLGNGASLQHKMVEKLLASDYEFLGLVDAHDGTIFVFGEQWTEDGAARSGSLYDEEMPRVLRGMLLDEYLEEGLRVMAREHILRELEDVEFFICSFPARDFGRTRAGRKQWKYTYLDATRAQILMTRTDITDVYTAERDPLTGLYNQQGFYRHAREILDHHPEQSFILLRCDIDRFKAYNDACGTAGGDNLLAAFGRAIRRRTWANLSVFARLEADHFCCLYPADELEIGIWEDVHADWLRSASVGYRLTSSMGIYEIVNPTIHVSLMCDRALLALRTVKDSYSKKLAWYDDNLRRKLIEEQAMVDDMETALSEDQFVLYFQPQVNYNNGALVGVEALVRWQHPRLGLIAPGAFIPLFEKNGFIRRLDAFVWEKSCQHLRKWMDLHPDREPVPCSVNISRSDIYMPNLPNLVHALVEKYGLTPDLLRLEITETAYMEDPEQLIGVVKELHSLGFTLEMDDFGAGYSSLNTLKDVPVDVLKLDIAFLSEGENHTRGEQILYSVIQMANLLQLPVIAEGVETPAQADYLKSLSCSYMQGYYFARPMPAEQFYLHAEQHCVNKLEWNSIETNRGFSMT